MAEIWLVKTYFNNSLLGVEGFQIFCMSSEAWGDVTQYREGVIDIFMTESPRRL